MVRLVSFVTATALSAAALVAGPTAALAQTAQRPTTSDGAVRMATYNVCKKSCGKGRFAWAKRRLAMQRTVAAARPDVLAIQEANTQRWRGRRHIDDVRELLGEAGYEIASTNYDDCTKGCTRGSHIFFDRTRMRLADLPGSGVAPAGMRAMSQIAGTGLGGIQDRNVAWAFLTPVGGTRTSLFVSVHLPTQKDATGEALRVAVARGLRPWADGLIAASGLSAADIVIAGDFNSFQRRQPSGAQQVLADAGLIDGYTAPARVNATAGTTNYTPKTKKYRGFPPRPFWYAGEPARIDYVFSTAAPLRHEVVLHLTGSGRFDDRFRASDHNMVMVDLPLA